MNRALAQQALDALEGVADWVNSRTKEHPWDQFQRLRPAIEALRAELAALVLAAIKLDDMLASPQGLTFKDFA